MTSGDASIKGYNCSVSQGLVITIPPPDFRLICLLLLAAFVLTVCSVATSKDPGKSPDSLQWCQHQQDVRNLNQYQTHGASAYISNQQKVYACFFWRQTGQDHYHLLLTNPLDSTGLGLNAQPGSVQLVDNKGQRYTSDDAEGMAGKLTRMPVPLNSLHQWILGPPGDTTDYKPDGQYHLDEITYSQNGRNWKVVYGGYDTKTQPAMSANMEPTSGSQRIKLKMDNWIVK